MNNSELFKKWSIFNKGMDAQSLQKSFANHIEYSLSKDQYTATLRDLYHSLALTARDRLTERWIKTQQEYYSQDAKKVYYLSAEYLMGRALINNLINLGIYDETIKAMQALNLDLNTLCGQEPDMGLGNGGLGRLAACFLDSMATLEIPAYGYGIRYEFGIFDQVVHNLSQVEQPENWLKYGNPWEFERPERSYKVHFYGYVNQLVLTDGRLKTEWLNTKDVVGTAYDTPICGFANDTVNTLRLWAARASKDFDLDYFQHGDYLKAVEEKNISENISKVLYPNDEFFEGRELRLKQEYFFVSCSIQDIIRRYLVKNRSFDAFPEKVAIQLNDTHPALAIVELMRLFLDEYDMSWEKSWRLTVNTCAYTNHTLMTEALEKWPVNMFGNLLPRHLQIIYEINRRFLRDVAIYYVNDYTKINRMSLIEEDPEKKVCMANLAIVGSHSINGVARLHSQLIKEKNFKDFNEMFPERFNNKTNGITPRRWLYTANPTLSTLITEQIGKDWIKELNDLKKLESLTESASFRKQWQAVKKGNKETLAKIAKDLTGFSVDITSIFDIQVKRIHEYKRQLLNIIHIVYLWLQLKENPGFAMYPRTFFLGGKAAPSYHTAKQIIMLICHVAEMLNNDKTTKDILKVLFLPNYRVSLAERIFPAADVSEQISTAGYEASGTSNMKFTLNGALTVGTLDGANIEIMEEVGRDNIFIFGLNAEEIINLSQDYRPVQYYQHDPLLKQAVDLIYQGFFNPEDTEMFKNLMHRLINEDRYFILADFAAYAQCQREVDRVYREQEEWTRRSILNVARVGKFSSDRTITEYNRDIWQAKKVKITKNGQPGFNEG